MDTMPGSEHRWYHPLGYQSQHGIYPDSGSFSAIGGSQSSQSYPAEASEHIFHSHADPDNGSWPRGGSHNPYHSICHQSTQHHLPSPTNLQDGSGNSPHSTGCSSRLYLPSTCGRSPHVNHQLSGCPNGPSNWHATYSQHLLSQTSSTYNSHGHSSASSNLSGEKDSKPILQREPYGSSYYNADDKPQPKLNLQSSVPPLGYSTPFYGSNANAAEFAASGLPYGMLGDMSRMSRYRGVTYPVADQGFGKSILVSTYLQMVVALQVQLRAFAIKTAFRQRSS